MAVDLRGHGRSDEPSDGYGDSRRWADVDNDDVLTQIRKPVLLTHGADDAIVTPAVVDRHKALVSHAQVHIMENTGHAPFWDQAASSNRRLRDFAANA